MKKDEMIKKAKQIMYLCNLIELISQKMDDKNERLMEAFKHFSGCYYYDIQQHRSLFYWYKNYMASGVYGGDSNRVNKEMVYDFPLILEDCEKASRCISKAFDRFSKEEGEMHNLSEQRKLLVGEIVRIFEEMDIPSNLIEYISLRFSIDKKSSEE